MRNKINTMIAVCGLAVLACTPVSLACDKDAAAQCPAHRTVKQVVEGKSSCSKSTEAAKTVQASGKPTCSSKSGQATTVQASAGTSACCPKTGKPVTVQASAVQGCPAEHVMKQLAMALMDMNENGGADAAGRTEVVKAMRIMADSKPELACDKVVKLMACDSKGGSTQAITVAAMGSGDCCGKCDGAKAVAAVGKGDCCGKCGGAKAVAAGNKTCDPSACSTKTSVQLASGKAACDPANCDPSKCAKGAKVIAAGGKKSCGSSAQARYVAYNCEKTDHMARAIAHAYVSLMRELKVTSGAEGCAATTATKVLASVLDEMQAEQAAAAAADASEGEVTIETVSFGAVADKSDAKKTCGSRN
ncbi:MAG: hypothetical protein ACYTFF_20425 [Planctomycetota bacterium]|jgi:hypothetical protein